MFRFKTLELVHWDYWERIVIPLDERIITIVGQNGSGKTTLLDALRTVLGIECSSKRDYKRYVRHAGGGVAWIKATVDNGRGPAGRRPFQAVPGDVATLVCRIQKKGGEWPRQYGILAGAPAIEEIQENVEWLGLVGYRQQLEGAGLTRAVSKVLAIEQGETDKLCEYSPQKLLELVFDVFGDKQVLDDYEKARADQKEAERELKELQLEVTKLELESTLAAERARNHEEWKKLRADHDLLEGEVLPGLRLFDAHESTRGAARVLRDERAELRELETRRAEKEAAAVAAAERRASRKPILSEKAELIDRLERALRARGHAIGKLEAVLAERERLRGLGRTAAEIDASRTREDLGALLKQQARFENDLTTLRSEKEQLESELADLRKGVRPIPEFEREFRRALDAADIPHCMLAEIVQVTDPEWAQAVEAMLFPYQHLILLERSDDRRRAFELGEKLRYQHFVVPDRSEPLHATAGSILEVIQFSAAPPSWLAKRLDHVARVRDVAAGIRLGDHREWVTREGYHREHRGGRHIGVSKDRYRFSLAARLEAVRERLSDVCDEIGGLEGKIDTARGEASRLTAMLDRARAMEDLRNREQEFETAELALGEAKSAVADLETQKTAAVAERAQHEELERQDLIVQATADAEIRQVLPREKTLREKVEHGRREHVGRILQYRQQRAALGATPDPERVSAWREKYGATTAASHELANLTEKLARPGWQTAPDVIFIAEKLRGDLAVRSKELEGRSSRLSRAMDATTSARAEYVKLLGHTIRQYAGQLRKLGELANVKVDVDYPRLENDDVVIKQAGLNVKFEFDEKGMIGLDDGEASGGQQVVKSLILLMALTADDRGGGGFVFIDEPFAHLDILNIELVGQFLTQTNAQYLITTPVTHNLEAFTPSALTLVTRKKARGARWAPVLGLVRKAMQ